MTTGARENGGVSERQNTSMLKATSVLNGCEQLISDGTDDRDEVEKLFCTAHQKMRRV